MSNFNSEISHFNAPAEETGNNPSSQHARNDSIEVLSETSPTQDLEMAYFTAQGVDFPSSDVHLSNFTATDHSLLRREIQVASPPIETNIPEVIKVELDPLMEITTQERAQESVYTVQLPTLKPERISSVHSEMEKAVASASRLVPVEESLMVSHSKIEWEKMSTERRIHKRYIGPREFLLLNEVDLTEFDEVHKWASQNPNLTLMEAFEHFESSCWDSPRTASLIYWIYSPHAYHYVMKYRRNEDIMNQFELGMLQNGLLLQKEVSVEDPNQVFVKIFAPFDVLCSLAERKKIKMRLDPAQVSPVSDEAFLKKHSFLVRKLVFALEDTLDMNVIYIPFKRKYIHLFMRGNPTQFPIWRIQTEFFNDHYTALLAFMVIDAIRVDTEERPFKRQRGLNYLIQKGYVQCFCRPHESLKPGKSLNARQYLIQHWASRIWTKQPLDIVKNYFGEAVGFYFAFTGLFQAFLFVASTFGAVVLVYGIGEVLSTSNPYWNRVFDNAVTPYFAFFMSLWALIYSEFWNRQKNYYTIAWGLDSNDNGGRQRPNDDFQPKAIRQNAYTGKLDLYFPASHRFERQSVSFFVFFIALCLVIGVVIGQAILNSVLRRTLSHDVSSIIVALIGMASVFVFRCIYTPLAIRLTRWENYRHFGKFEDALLWKRWTFEFVNIFSHLAYFAFIRPLFVQTSAFGLSEYGDPCGKSCSPDVLFHLSFFYFAELLVRYSRDLMGWLWKTIKPKKTKSGSVFPTHADSRDNLPPYYQDAKLTSSGEMKDRYFWKLIEFSYVTLFVAAFPVLPVVAFLTESFALRSEASDLLMKHWRKHPETRENLETYVKFLQFIARFSVMTNAFVVAFTSKAFDEWVGDNNDRGRYWAARFAFVIIWNALLYGLLLLVQITLPRMPSLASIAQRRQERIENMYHEKEVDPTAISKSMDFYSS